MNITESVPKVSVCVVTYNHEKFIGQCLQSIVDQVTDFDFELIVGDDGSSDRTPEIVREFAAKYPKIVRPVLHEKNVGPTKNYQSVHGLSRGEFVCHCDGDDYWLPNKLQAQTEFMERNPRCNVSGHRMYVTDDSCSLSNDGRPELPTISDLSAFYKYGNYLPHSSTMYRASCGRVPDVAEGTIDFLVHIWRVKDGEIGFLNQYLGVYRRHSASVTSRSYHSLHHFRQNLIALEEIHKVVKNVEEFERNKFALCKDCVKNFIVSGRMELAKEVARDSSRFVSKKRHGLLLNLMIFFSDAVGMAVRTKRKYL